MPESNPRELNNGSANNSISLPHWMWELIDVHAVKHDWTRSVYCKRAILRALLLEMVNDPQSLDLLYQKGLAEPNQ